MSKNMAKTMRKEERGMALLLTLFALLLLSGIGLFLVVSSNTETRIDANYGSGLRAYYSARSGLEEVRDRMKYPQNPALSGSQPWGIADLLPQDIAGNSNGVLYILNPAPGETVDPTDPTSPYFDDDLCHQYNSGTSKGVKCTTVPATQNWQMKPQPSLVAGTGQLNYKWIRITMKTNRAVLPSFCVDLQPDCSTAPLDTRVCWDGKAEQLSPGGSCDANGMQTIYMLTSLAVTGGAVGPNGARKLLQIEVVAPSIRPAGAVTAASMNVSSSGAAGIPPLAIDGRAHKLDGSPITSPPPGNVCSDISALATDTGSSQLEQALNQMRKNIVDTANASCNADGSAIGSNKCSPGLWWVRGTDLSPRFVTTVTSITSGSSGSGSSGSDGHGGGDGDDHVSTTTVACGSGTPNCYTNLSLAAPQLFGTSAVNAPHIPTVTGSATAPFIGGSGNQADSTIYQPGAKQTVADQIAAVNNLVAANVGQQNYFTATSTTLAASYGDSGHPAIVVFTDPTLSLQSATASLSGYGVLVVSNALEIGNGGTLNWNGIVLINSSAGHVTVSSSANGTVNGALLLAPGAVFNLSNSASTAPSFLVKYSCEAIDLTFTMQPFKVISTAETSF